MREAIMLARVWGRREKCANADACSACSDSHSRRTRVKPFFFFVHTMRTLRALLIVGFLACIVSTRAATLYLQNSSPCTAFMGVSATPFMCFMGGKLVTIPPGNQWGGPGFDDSCVSQSAGGSIACNGKTIQCQGATERPFSAKVQTASKRPTS